MIKIPRYLHFLLLVYSTVFIPICHVKAVQDDITLHCINHLHWSSFVFFVAHSSTVDHNVRDNTGTLAVVAVAFAVVHTADVEAVAVAVTFAAAVGVDNAD